MSECRHTLTLQVVLRADPRENNFPSLDHEQCLRCALIFSFDRSAPCVYPSLLSGMLCGMVTRLDNEGASEITNDSQRTVMNGEIQVCLAATAHHELKDLV